MREEARSKNVIFSSHTSRKRPTTVTDNNQKSSINMVMRSKIKPVIALLVISHIHALTLASRLPRGHVSHHAGKFHPKQTFDIHAEKSSSNKKKPLTLIRAGSSSNTNDINKSGIREKVTSFADKNFFLVGMFVAVALAKMFPSVSLKKCVITINVDQRLI